MSPAEAVGGEVGVAAGVADTGGWVEVRESAAVGVLAREVGRRVGTVPRLPD